MKHWLVIVSLFCTTVFADPILHHYQPSHLIMVQSTSTPTSLPFVTLKSPDTIDKITEFYQKLYPEYQLITQSSHYRHLAQKKSTTAGIKAYANIPNIKIFRTPEHNSQYTHTLIQIFHSPKNQRIH